MNLRASRAILRPNRAGVNKMRATRDRKKQAVALTSLFDVPGKKPERKEKRARLGVSDRKLSPCMYTRSARKRPNVTGVATPQLQATGNGDIFDQKWRDSFCS